MTQGSTQWLSAHHRQELDILSSIDPEVSAERGYRTIERPGRNGGVTHIPDVAYVEGDSREFLRRAGFPSWAVREDHYYPGLWIPQYTPRGQRYAGQFKPFRPIRNPAGKLMRYASAKGQNRLDVHPRWSADRGRRDAALVPAIQDPSMPLWITEGVKKADSLTSRGCVTVALAGVYSWRNTHATLGDWEDVALRGREVWICFDADAITKSAVARAMERLGKWLRHKGAAKVRYVVTPGMAGGNATKGVDDYFAAGGTLADLRGAARDRAPEVADTSDAFTDARMTDRVADELSGTFAWCKEFGWLDFDGRRWRDSTEEVVVERWRVHALDEHADAATDLRAGNEGAVAKLDGWRGQLSASRMRAVVGLARGPLGVAAEVFDADPLALNTPGGYVDLETGAVRPVGGGEYPTKITGASFDPGARSPLWDVFLDRILPDVAVREFVARLFGYALLGVVREHIMPIFTGTGANGKGTLRDAVLAALGDYALEVDPELLMASHNPRHGTFLMELRGRRLVFCSETQKGRRFAESTMNRLVGGDPIQANRMHKDPITFQPSHTLIMNTNHLPAVSGNDPAVWRRIRVVPFDVVIPEDERDGTLPGRLCEPGVQAAVLAWIYAGYRQYAERGLDAPDAVRVRTEAYRCDSDDVGRFLAERVDADTSASRVTARDLHDAYARWIRVETGNEPLAKQEFGRELSRRGMESVKVGGNKIYRVHLISDEILDSPDQLL